MKDNYISRAAVSAAALWAVAIALVLIAWALAIADAPDRWGRPVAVTAVLAMAGAIICQTRLYALRLCGLIRVSAGLETPNAEVHPLLR